MHTELQLSLSTLFSFLMALARIAGVVALTPLPGLKDGPDPARVVLAFAITVITAPAWPAMPGTSTFAELAVQAGAEAITGVLIGLTVSWIFEGAQIAAHLIGLQAGFSFASTVDPNTQADSSVLQIAIQLLAGMLFLTMGLDRQLVLILARSFYTLPAGAFPAREPAMGAMIRAGSGIFITGLRLAMPVLALLLLMDVAVAVLGRIQAQLQLLSFSFSLKMLAGIGMLAGSVAFYPSILETSGHNLLNSLERLLAP